MAEVMCWPPREGKQITLLLSILTAQATALALGLHRAAPLPCPADAGVELLGDAEPWGGDRSKRMEQENVKL